MKIFLMVFAFCMAAPTTASAVVSKCKNSKARVQYTNGNATAPSNSHNNYICVHKSKYYKKNAKCPSGYSLSGNACQKTKAAKKKCAFGQKICSNSYCVGALKACKRSNKKGTPTTTCTGSGWRASDGKCVKTTSASDQRCPVGWFKAKFGPDHSKSYCKTNR